MMPLKCSTASYQFRCHDEAYLFSTVVDFISSSIFVSCQGKLRFEVSFIVFGWDNEVSAESENCDTFGRNFASPNLTIRMVWPGEGVPNKRSPAIDCFTLITLEFYDFYAATFLPCNENDFRQQTKGKLL